jgi:hypothetical protein
VSNQNYNLSAAKFWMSFMMSSSNLFLLTSSREKKKREKRQKKKQWEKEFQPIRIRHLYEESNQVNLVEGDRMG